MQKRDLLGQQFGQWTVIAEAQKGRGGKSRWLCRCICGTERVVYAYSLLGNGTQACGRHRFTDVAQIPVSSLRMTRREWARFHAKIDHKACWVWRGAKDQLGYGHARIGGKVYPAHRISYLVYKGNIAPGKEIDHLCRNSSCVHPDHLEAVTHAVNMARSMPATKTHCRNGHEFSGRNKRQRLCRICRNVSNQLYKRRKKARRSIT